MIHYNERLPRTDTAAAMTAPCTHQELTNAVEHIIAAAERAAVNPLTLSPDAITLTAAMLIACQRTGVPMTVADALTAIKEQSR